MKIFKYKDISNPHCTFSFYGYHDEATNKIIEVDQNNEQIDSYENDHNVSCIQEFDDRKRQAESVRLCDLRQVELFFINSSHHEKDIVHKDDVDTYIKAKKELHFDPETKRPTATELAYIRVGEFKNQGSFWHTTPGHSAPGFKDSDKGAQVFCSWGPELVWKNPKIKDLD
ncbi:hypothetical protein PP938_gp240 [Rhizobium phage AF3]|uniref:Uncharacterized protein n=1 Tax=Rhizobium phage AF3 TaxID=2763529 RepID=A0A7G7WW49_9CAUD|nr:hypothetical protein PP938_gp240 [Rhizobium phage AF3]QNH71443.1 hypothetical protein AF3_240 [Rhizobium phage AF3]